MVTPSIGTTTLLIHFNGHCGTANYFNGYCGTANTLLWPLGTANPLTSGNDVLLEELDGAIDVLHPLAVLVQKDGQLFILHVDPLRLELKELWPDVFHVELHDLVDPHVVDSEVGGTQRPRLVLVHGDNDALL